MPGRKFAVDGSYRFGFNGKENDNEVKGEGNHYDYGFRIYDPRIAKFLSVDPLAKSFPWYTPYQFAGNKPIIAIDLDGLEEKIVISNSIIRHKPSTQIQTAISLLDQSVAHSNAINHIINRLNMEELSSPKEPRNVVEFGTMGELTVSEKREIIENTVRQFTICIASDQRTNPDFNPNTVSETYSATYDFNYTLLGNKEKIDDIKSAVKTATTVIEFASEARDITGKLPDFLDQISTPTSIVQNAIDGNHDAIIMDVAKFLVDEGLDQLAKKAPSLGPIINFAKSNPVILTIQFAFTNSAPEYDFEEKKAKRTEELRMKTIAALLFLFENNNKARTSIQKNIQPSDVDNTRVATSPEFSPVEIPNH